MIMQKLEMWLKENKAKRGAILCSKCYLWEREVRTVKSYVLALETSIDVVDHVSGINIGFSQLGWNKGTENSTKLALLFLLNKTCTTFLIKDHAFFIVFFFFYLGLMHLSQGFYETVSLSPQGSSKVCVHYTLPRPDFTEYFVVLKFSKSKDRMPL